MTQYLVLTHAFCLTEAKDPNDVAQNIMIPMDALPVFEGVDRNHSEYGSLNQSHGVNCLVRVKIGDVLCKFKVQETVEQIAGMQNDLYNHQV